MQRFFYDNMIEYIYNNYTPEFIKKYVPEIFVDITNVEIPFYYYNTEYNFGDLITPYLLTKYCEKDTYKFDFSNKNPKISTISIINQINTNFKTKKSLKNVKFHSNKIKTHHNYHRPKNYHFYIYIQDKNIKIW